jgi:hypothetical protein
MWLSMSCRYARQRSTLALRGWFLKVSKSMSSISSLAESFWKVGALKVMPDVRYGLPVRLSAYLRAAGYELDSGDTREMVTAVP